MMMAKQGIVIRTRMSQTSVESVSQLVHNSREMSGGKSMINHRKGGKFKELLIITEVI